MTRLLTRSVSALAITALAFGACSSVGFPTSNPTTSAAAPTSIASDPARSPWARWRWVRTGTPGQAVTAGGPGWVLVGSDAPIDDASSIFHVPAAWTSVDGGTWTRSRVALPSGASSGEFTVVAPAPDGIVAAGTVDLVRGTVWRSEDGRSWDVIGTGPLFDIGPCFEGCARMTSIAAGRSAIVVSGYRVAANLEADVWVSIDRGAWRRVALPTPAGGGGRVAAETTLAATSSGFIAAGSICRAGGTACRAVTWTSADGKDWLGPTDLPDGAGCNPLRVVVGRGRTVIVGQRCADGCRYTAWSSVDASTWSVGDLLGGDIASQERGLVTFSGGQFLVIGSRGDRVEVWSSIDGLAWQKEPLEPGTFAAATQLLILDLAGRGNAALAAGRAGDREQSGVWTSP